MAVVSQAFMQDRAAIPQIIGGRRPTEIGASGAKNQRRGLIPAIAAFPPACFPIGTGAAIR